LNGTVTKAGRPRGEALTAHSVPTPEEISPKGKQLPYEIKEEKGVQRVKTGYVPRKFQLELHQNLKRFNVLVCHRRFGKTVLAVNHLIHRALCNPLRNPQYAYIAPTYKAAKRIAWQYFVDYTRHLPNVRPNKTELTVYIDRPDHIDPLTEEKDPDEIKIMLIGADDPDSIRGIYLDGAILDEFAQCDPIIWGQVVRPALGDRKKIARELGLYYDTSGYDLEPWAIFIGTPKGQNHFFRRFKGAEDSEAYCAQYEKDHDIAGERIAWDDFEETYGIDDNTSQKELGQILKKISSDVEKEYKAWRKYKANSNWMTALFKASETGVLDLDEIEEMTEDLTEDQIRQELECDFNAAILGSYYGNLIVKAREANRICKVPYDSRYPVDTHWDIGVGDKTTIWFRQKVNGKYHYIHYYEQNGQGVDHYIKVLDALKEFEGKKTEVEEGEVITGRGFKYGRHVWPHDGKVQEFGSGQSRQETARKKGLKVEIQPKQRREDRIQASRDRIKISYFDEEHCERGIDCLYNYEKEYDEKLMIFKPTPKHNWASHGADGFGYSSLDDRDSYFEHDITQLSKNRATMDYNELTH